MSAAVKAPPRCRSGHAAEAFEELSHLIRCDEPLSLHTSFEIGGPAKFFAAPQTAEEVCALAQKAQQAEMPLYVLGGGTNLLVDDAGVQGLVLHLGRLREFRLEGDRLHVGPGFPLPKLVNVAAGLGLAGFERFAGIPGTVGGMLRTNTGGRHGTLSEALHSALLLQRDGRIGCRLAPDFQFGHRRSNLQDEIALELIFKVEQDDPAQVAARRDEIMQMKVRSQPFNARSAGCIFRNPPGEHASRLIDQCGLKGARSGGAVVSHTHANFICNEKKATAADVVELIEHVRQIVRQKIGYVLELEVNLWP